VLGGDKLRIFITIFWGGGKPPPQTLPPPRTTTHTTLLYMFGGIAILQKQSPNFGGIAILRKNGPRISGAMAHRHFQSANLQRTITPMDCGHGIR